VQPHKGQKPLNADGANWLGGVFCVLPIKTKNPTARYRFRQDLVAWKGLTREAKTPFLRRGGVVRYGVGCVVCKKLWEWDQGFEKKITHKEKAEATFEKPTPRFDGQVGNPNPGKNPVGVTDYGTKGASQGIKEKK